MYIPKENLMQRKDGKEMKENMKEYRKSLEKEMNIAEERFERAKREAAERIINMDWNTAESFGAGYAAKIEQISIEAAKMRALGCAISELNYFVDLPEETESYRVTVNFYDKGAREEYTIEAENEDAAIKQMEDLLRCEDNGAYEIMEAVK